ncbi:MAG: hypothetical protein HC869_20055 [Rhodospirillales bacterium]|nr:hypothetical protein [Rhodospirillales bacterium]
MRNGSIGTMFPEHPKAMDGEDIVRAHLFAGLLMALMPAAAAAEGTAQPQYPPSFDCSAVPAGSQRQACNRSHLDPPMGSIEQPKRVQPDSLVRQPKVQPLPTDKPPTIPRLPGTIQNND